MDVGNLTICWNQKHFINNQFMPPTWNDGLPWRDFSGALW